MKADWPTVRLDECCEIVSGATPKTSNDEYWDGDVCWVTPKDLSDLDGAYISDTPRKLTRAGLESCAAAILPAGSVLFSSRAPIGHVAVNTVPMATNQGFKSFVPKTDLIHAKFLYHWLRTNRSYLESLGNGATFKEVSKSVISRVKIALPPLEEQKRIADILDRAEALRSKRRSALAQLDELTQSIFTEMFGDPVKNPRDWKLEKVQAVISQIEAGWSANGEPRPREENEYAVLKVSAVTQGVFLPEECKVINNDIEFKKVVTPEKGDVLFSRANTLELVGASCLIRENYPYLLLPDKLWKIRVNEEKICPEYFKFVLSYPTIRHEISKRSTGTSGSMYNISMDKFRLIKITVPPIPIQCEFARRITSMEKLKEANKVSLAELDEFFVSLQYRAFRGELT